MKRQRSCRTIRRSAVAMAVLIPAVCFANPTFVFNTTGTVPQEMMDGMNAAAARWSANFSNNVTITINFSSAALGSGIIGSTSSVQNSYVWAGVSGVRTALTNTATSADDLAATSHLPGNSTSFPVYMNYSTTNPNGSGSATPWLDNDGDSNNTNVRLTNANARALGLTAGSTDATMQFSTAFAFDYNPRDGINGSQFDFVGVATHEIGHSLGFISGVDTLDGTTNSNERNYRVTTPDLFRYSTASAAQGAIDFRADTAAKYFSLDGGQTSLYGFSTGVSHGDGQQASHWKDGQGIGIMDPTAGFGEYLLMSEADRRLFDVIGWTRDYTWEWTYQPGGSFNDPLNWNAFGVPTSGIDAVFEMGQIYGSNVTVTANTTVRDLINRNDTFTLAPNASTRTLTVSRNFIVGDTAGATASLTFPNGLLTTPTTMLGTALGATGNFNFIGGTWTNTGSVYVGGTTSAAAGSALLTISSPGTFTAMGTLQIYATGAVNITNGQTILGALNITQGGSLTFSSTKTLSSASTLNNGTLSASAGTLTLGPITGTGSLLASGSAAFKSPRILQTSVSLTGSTASIQIAASGGSILPSIVNSISITQGLFDLTDNDLIVPAGGTSEASLDALVASWYHNGARNGSGLGSSLATTYTTLAVVPNTNLLGGRFTATFDGVATNLGDVLVKYTYLGDLDLNGTVNVDDLDALTLGLADTSLSGWRNGDINYDGQINLTDLNLLLASMNNQGTALEDSLATPPSMSVVPEPSALLLAAMPLMLLGRRRR